MFHGRLHQIVLPFHLHSINKACKVAQSGDIVLIAGKGHEKYQIIGKEKFHFDDLEETIKVFKNKT